MEAITGYRKRKDFLVCVDSDGCAMDTMECKHRHCFGPCLVEEWGLEAYAGQVLERWNEINLYSVTRGINRFSALALLLREIGGGIVPAEGIGTLEEWTMSAPELSETALAAELERRPDPCLAKALRWSRAVNRKIAELPEDAGRPFPGVRESLGILHESADIAVVSSANRDAVRDEWTRSGLADFADIFLTQEAGSKKACIAAMLRFGYRAENVLMAGDAPGDLKAASDNGTGFFPVLAGKEEESWKALREEGIRRLVSGTFRGGYAESLLESFYKNFHAVT